MNLGGFNFKTLLGITRLKRNISKSIGVPFTKGGFERKVGSTVIKELKILIEKK